MKTIVNYLLAGLIYLLISSCHIAPPRMVDNHTPVGLQNSIDLQEYKSAYFASGCFWCVEAIYESVYGVEEVISGYAGGTTVNPSYQQIGTGRTGHAETVEVYYDPSKVDFKTLLAVFFNSHDPTTKNRQDQTLARNTAPLLFTTTIPKRKSLKTILQSSLAIRCLINRL